MRYIYLKLVKTDEDKKRVKGFPKLPKKDLEKMIRDKKETKVITEATAKSSLVKNMATQKMVVEDIAKTLADKKHLLSKTIKPDLKPKKKPPVFKDKSGTYLLNDASSQAMDLYLIKKIRENKDYNLKIYSELYERLGKKISKAPKKARDQFQTLPASHSLNSSKLASDLKKLSVLALEWLLPESLIASDPTNPGPETGEGNKTDQYTWPSCVTENPQPNPKGFIRNFNWPLKPHLTSVKNQATRGTCTAFGTVAAIESGISRKYSAKVNLSEQDLYKKQKLDWNPNIWDDYYGDGYFPPVSMLFQMLSGYVFPFESSWEYNPSLMRSSDDNLRKYTNSCNNYTGACSDTNHQSDKTCYTMDVTETKQVVDQVCEWTEGIPIIGQIAGWACHNVTNWVTETVGQVEVCVYDTNIEGDSRYKLNDFVLIWDPIWENDLSLAKVMLALCKPVIFCFTVADSFNTSSHSTTDGKGFVIFSAGETVSADAGGHCVEMVGYIDNSNIPAASNLTPGAGGGYFIIKNSWGKCFGDMGYAYLPADWVKKWGTSMVAVTDVQRI